MCYLGIVIDFLDLDRLGLDLYILAFFEEWSSDMLKETSYVSLTDCAGGIIGEEIWKYIRLLCLLPCLNSCPVVKSDIIV